MTDSLLDIINYSKYTHIDLSQVSKAKALQKLLAKMSARNESSHTTERGKKMVADHPMIMAVVKCVGKSKIDAIPLKMLIMVKSK